MIVEPSGDKLLRARRQPRLPGERVGLLDRVAVARHVECFGPGLARLADYLQRQPPKRHAAVVPERVPDLIRRPPDILPRAGHPIEVRRVGVFRAQHVFGPGLQLHAFLSPGEACGMRRIEPSAFVERQVRRTASPPRRHAAGKGADLFRQRRLRRVNRPPFRHCLLWARLQPLGGRKPLAQLRHLPIALR